MMMQGMLRLSLLLLAFCLSAHAGTMAFFPDGKKVAFVREESVAVKNLVTLEETALTLPEGFAAGSPALATTADRLLVAGNASIISLDPATGTWETRCSAPQGRWIRDLAVNPSTGQILVVTVDADPEQQNIRWWILGDGGQLQRIYIRSVTDPQAPVFDTRGALWFCLDGDLWKGSIEEEEELPFALEAARHWPIAERETSAGNSLGGGARSLLPLRSTVLADYGRIGGSGWGWVTRLPASSAWDGQVSLRGKKLLECEFPAAMALSYDGSQALLHAEREGKWYRLDPAAGTARELTAPAAAPSGKKKPR